MESTLRAPNGDITVVLVPEHHQAHKELCKDKQDNLISLYFLKGEGRRTQGVPFLSEHSNKRGFRCPSSSKYNPLL